MRSTDNRKRFNGTRLRIAALKFVTPAAVLAFLVMMLRFSGYAKAQYKAIPNYTGINAGLQFRNDINNHLSGQTPIAPRLVSLPFAQLPAEQDGWLFWCRDCRVSTPCQGGGSGAVATGEGGVWTCGGQTPLVSNFNANNNRIINLAPNTTSGDALSQGQSRLNDLAAPNASYSLNGQRLTSAGTDTTNGDVLSRGQSTLNSLGAATSNYAMGGNTLTGMAAASASGQPIIYGQSGAQLAAASASGQPLVYAQKNAQVTTYTPAAYLANSATNSISGTTTSISLSKPAGISNGNAELLICNTSNQPAIDASWTLWRHDTGSFRDLWTLKHIVSSDPSSYTITWSPNAGGGNGCAIVGLANSSGFDSITGQYCGSGQCTASAPVSTYGNELVLVVGSDGNNFAFPSLIAPTYAAKAADFFGGNIGTTAWTYNTTPVPATLDTSWTTQQIVQQMTILGAPYQSAPVLQNQSGATVASLNATNVSAPNTISGFSVAKVWNVRDPFFGAAGNDVNDDSAAIQAAYNYACSNGGGALYFPPGKYLVNSPLLFNCTTAQIEASGAGELVSTLDAGGRTGPVIIVSPTASIITASGPLTASSLLSGSGVALNWTANSTIVWNIKEWMVAGGSGDKANPLNGLANFTWENWANLSSSATNGNVYCVTQSHAYVSYNATTALRICATANGALSGSLNVGGTAATVSGGTFTKGATHAIAFVLDSAGSTDNHCTAGNPCLRLYLDGTEVNNAQVSGTIQQAADEDWGLGTGDPFDGQWPESWASGSTNGWYGTIDSVRVSKTARYTASSYTPSSSKLGSDGNTLLLINGDLPAAGANIATTGIIEADSKTSGNAAQWAYVRSTAWPVTSALQKIHDLSISAQSGEPLYVDATPGFQAFNMRLTGGYKGVNCRNNTFESRFENLTVTMGNYSESGLSMSCGEIVNLDNIQVYNGVYNVVLSEGNYDVRNLFLTPIATTLIDLYESASSIFSQFTHSEVNSDSENGGPTQANLWIDDVQPGEHTFTGGNLQSLAATNVPPVWLNNQAASSVLFNNVNFSTAGGSTGPIVHFLGAPLSGEQVTAINPRLNGNPYSMTQQPLVDTAYASFATVLGHHLVIGGAPTLNGGMNNVAVNIVTDPPAPTISVHGATGSTSYGPYYVVCHDTNGGATNPSSASNSIANGPSSLNASNYIQVSLGTLPAGCATYDVLRVTTATALATGVANTGGAQTYNDIGQSTAAYTPPARNTTGDITFGTMAVSTGVAWPLPGSVVNGASFYCPNCDPPANPPAACTSSGAKTGSMVSGIHSQWICHY